MEGKKYSHVSLPHASSYCIHDTHGLVVFPFSPFIVVDMQKAVFGKFKFFSAGMQVLVFETVQISLILYNSSKNFFQIPGCQIRLKMNNFKRKHPFTFIAFFFQKRVNWPFCQNFSFLQKIRTTWFFNDFSQGRKKGHF